MKFRLLLLLAVIMMVFTSALRADSLERVLVPAKKTDGWLVDKAVNAGFDGNEMLALANALVKGEYTNIHAVLVEHQGKIVYEQYLTGTDQNWGRPIGEVAYDGSQVHDLRSISKSVTALLLGIAINSDFDSALDRPLLDYFPNFKARKTSDGIHEVSLRHVLTMSAGFDWNEMTVPYSNSDNDEIQLYNTVDPVGYVLNKKLKNKPGERWYYSGGMTTLIGAIVERLSGKPLLEFANEKLFEPLGIEDYTWHSVYQWPADSMPAVASGLRLRPRDLAKIGSLMINKGRWQGRNVVAEDWIQLSQKRYRNDMHSWAANGIYGYGLHWWQGQFNINNEIVNAAVGSGYGGQKLYTVADRGISITILAGNYGAIHEKTRWQADHIFKRVLSALKE